MHTTHYFVSSSSSVCSRNHYNIQWLNLKNGTKDKPLHRPSSYFFIVIRLPFALTPFQIWINGDNDDDLLIHATHKNSTKPLTYFFLMFSLNSFSVLFKLDKKNVFYTKKIIIRFKILFRTFFIMHSIYIRQNHLYKGIYC